MSSVQNSKDIEVGDTAPDFELLDTNQESQKLSDYNKKGLTILAFFPAAGSPVCTVELCNFRDSINDLEGKNVKILGISVDSPFANKVFAEHHKFNFPILSDYDRDVIEKYNVVMPSLGKLKDFKVAKRSIFVIDDKLKVIYKWVSDNPLVEPNYEEIKKVTSTK
ncbi:MAG: redoxin domain-containing protein [Candidatus Nitrosocosmicus sp.]|jgi:peroxiredoxin|uniref:redoxin domain-containing protein n=1 Tax=Candidatus Nitrosocosmicus agrestis TaxID=2563600 RepID=UPI00122E47CC|nr:redoxin domain-containing protein [Candidatus Nitrosocosmicus sp. SS]MDR4490672.1 redoxin domain-containing protein [Candidatus Nitrosocosmicus sp.]HET8793899.1 redoxin domain-containing protein [Nitrososphaeraceae archaeon]KAA2281975.1 redoxin domain-containing protein [Candidatus Nitrosocosmicus sp. SS]KAF0869880.1 redoxin domain-containing protein [Candidatus Nitrosocosmicus sp. SS]HET6590775.1 redoxin domain-containing protein [Candidatus Nitrosocosmicus sp.]